MALKMRFLYYSKKSKMKALAEAIKVEFGLTQNYNAIDIIPPAYSCENERLVILAISGGNDLDDMVRRFCRELDKKKAQNVALLIDGNEKLVEAALSVLKETGTNIIEDVKVVKFGGLPFIGGKLSDNEKSELLSWVHSVVDSIK
jgi:hypothetical protein